MSGSDNSDSAQVQVNDGNNNMSRKASRPSYLHMLLNSIHEQNSRNGVSRVKIVQHMKSKYKLEDISAPALRKAVQSAERDGLIENKTGAGMNGKFSLTSKQKLEFKNIKKKSASAASASEKKAEPKIKPKPKVHNEDKGEVKAKTKKAADVGKENQPKWKKGDPIRKPKILQAKVALTKAKISRALANSAMEDPVSSTSKQRNPGKKKANILL